jgi:hypothetical protein
MGKNSGISDEVFEDTIKLKYYLRPINMGEVQMKAR